MSFYKEKRQHKILQLLFLTTIFFSAITSSLSTSNNSPSDQTADTIERKSEKQKFEDRFIQSQKDIQEIFELRSYLNQIRNDRTLSLSIRQDNLMKIYLKLVELYQKIKLQDDSQHFIKLANEIDSGNPQVLYQKTRRLIFNFDPNSINNNQTKIEKYLQALKQSEQKNFRQKNTRFMDLYRLFGYKKIAFKKGYEYSFDWMKSIQKNQLKFQYISHDKIQKRWLKQKGGYGVFAKQQIQQHKVLIVEKPFFYLGESQGISFQNQNQNKIAVLKKYKSLFRISKIFRQKYSQLSSKKAETLPFDERISQTMLSDQQIYDKYIKNSFFINQLSDIMKKVNRPYYRVGLYSFTDLINHSCDPNSSYSFIGDYLLLRSQRKIFKDQEITYAYIKTYNKSTSQRKQQIFYNWEFQCNCDLCKRDGIIYEPKQENSQL